MHCKQMPRVLVAVTCLATALVGGGDNKPELSSGSGARLRGAAQKGPFILGSSTTVATLTATGTPTDDSALNRERCGLLFYPALARENSAHRGSW